MGLITCLPLVLNILEKLVALFYVKKCQEIYHMNLIIRKKVSVMEEYHASGEDILGNTV